MRKMAAKPAEDPFQSFLDERKSIVTDIKQFLKAVLNCCHSIKERIKVRSPAQDVVAGITDGMSRNLHFVIKSLSLLHGLYAYPNSSNQDVTGRAELLHNIMSFGPRCRWGKFCWHADIIMARKFSGVKISLHLHGSGN